MGRPVQSISSTCFSGGVIAYYSSTQLESAGVVRSCYNKQIAFKTECQRMYWFVSLRAVRIDPVYQEGIIDRGTHFFDFSAMSR